MGKWCVYRHTLPDGRYYIGITSQTPEGRWKNGFGYENQRKFFEEILAFGWNNIRHEIIVSGLDETEARKIELKMLESRDTLNAQYAKKPRKGFNPKVLKNLRSYRPNPDNAMR